MTVSAEKVWDVQVGYNDVYSYMYNADVDVENRLVMYAIKRGLITGAGAWTVVSSSDGSSSGASDLWTDQTKLIWGTSTRSWIVLKQTGINASGNGFQICIDLVSSSTVTENCTIVASYSAGFTGGSTTARPTATDEIVFHNNANWGASATNYVYRTWVAKSSDGECTRVFMNTSGSVASNMWIIDKPKNPIDGWTKPVVATAQLVPHYANCHDAFSPYSCALIFDESGSGYITRQLWFTCQSFGAGALTQNSWFQAPDRDGNWLCLPIGFALESAAYCGRWGELYDLWFVPPALPSGEYMKGGGGDWDFVVFGDFLQAWDGTYMDLLQTN